MKKPIKKLQGLFAKAVIVLFIISMVPVLIIGYRTMRANSALLQNELLQKQQIVGERLAFIVSDALKDQEQVLREFGDLHVNFENPKFISTKDLTYLQQYIPGLFYLAILTPTTSDIAFAKGKLPVSSFFSIKETLLKTCLNGERFTSAIYYDPQGKPFIWLGEPLYSDLKKTTVSGVLAATLYLDDIIELLSRVYPLDMDALLVSGGGEILSYNGAPESLGGEYSSELRQKVRSLRKQLADRESAVIKLDNKERVLASVVRVSRTDWHIYLFQPGDIVQQLFFKSFFNSFFRDLAIILLVMIVFVGVVSYLVIIPITRPLARLREAAVKLQEDENFVIQHSDVEIPHNEIGDLANGFVEMSHVLHQRRQELIKTQQELALINQVLEERVEKRTRELQVATRELVKNERLATIGEMASIISHEIRNPLAVISNATRLIKTLVQPKEQKLIKQFNVIEGEIRQANGIISEVLGYARAREMIFSLVDVNNYLKEIIISFPIPAHITLNEQLDPESVRIKIDAEEIKQALRNIISNAVDAMPKGGTLTIGSRVGRRLVCIYIQDTGPGLTEEVRQSMFSPFFTTKARGTGLGLAVVHKAIVRHKGKLFIKSELGKGTCFYIYLKIYRKVGDTNYGKAS